MNLTAFLIRFQKTCWSRAGSASTWWRGGREVERRAAAPCRCDLAAADLDGLADQVVGVDDLPVQRQLAPDDPRHVEQVVDQPGLEVDVPADHLQGRADLGRAVAGSSSIAETVGQDGGQRGPQLVAEDGEELVLGPVGRLGLVPGELQAAPRLLALGDVELTTSIRWGRPRRRAGPSGRSSEPRRRGGSCGTPPHRSRPPGSAGVSPTGRAAGRRGGSVDKSWKRPPEFPGATRGSRRAGRTRRSRLRAGPRPRRRRRRLPGPGTGVPRSRPARAARRGGHVAEDRTTPTTCLSRRGSVPRCRRWPLVPA